MDHSAQLLEVPPALGPQDQVALPSSAALVVTCGFKHFHSTGETVTYGPGGAEAGGGHPSSGRIFS